MPEELLRPGPLGLLLWQWLALPLLIVGALAAGHVLGGVTRALLSRIAARTPPKWDDRMVDGLRGPLTLMWAAVVFGLALPLLDLHEVANRRFARALDGAAFFAIFWMVLRSIDVGVAVASESAWAQSHPLGRSFLPLGGRLVKIGVVAIAVAGLLAIFGFPVASVLAGLGVGGLAVALAAQKTFENLFGAFSIGLDQPFRVGDTVKVGDLTGTVERIGLRSTQIRTPDRTRVTIPNGTLADSRVEDFAARDRIRFHAIVALSRETRAEPLRRVLAGFERGLRGHPLVWSDDVVVRLAQLGTSSFDVEVTAWFSTTDGKAFMTARQEVLLGFMDTVEREGVAFCELSRPPARGA